LKCIHRGEPAMRVDIASEAVNLQNPQAIVSRFVVVPSISFDSRR
jgi:hypothetical protein